MEKINSNVINSIIGFGTVFSGDLDLTGLLKIDGDFVELGTGKGFVMSCVLASIKNWDEYGKNLLLFDTSRRNFLTPPASYIV